MAELTVLSGRTLSGRLGQWQVKGDQLIELPGSALITQRVRALDGTVLVRRSLPEGSDDAQRQLLDNEIRSLARLANAFPPGQARPFPELVGYDVDSADPWALVTDYQGQPAPEVLGSLLRADLELFAVNLFQAIAHLDAVEATHNRINQRTLYLTRTSVQIVTFEHSALFGEPLPDGRGAAHPKHDILAAGNVLYEAFTGVPLGNDRPDLRNVSWLSSHMADVFGEPRGRPVAADVLRRLGSTGIPVAGRQVELLVGQAAFDAARDRKMPPPPETIRTRPVKAAPPPSRPSTTIKPLLVAGLCLLVLALVFVALGVLL